MYPRPVSVATCPRFRYTVPTMPNDFTFATLLQDDPEFQFTDPNGHQVVRHLHVWRVQLTGIVAVVTERYDDQGMSITNAAEQLVDAVRRLYPRNPDLVVVEHYPDDPGFPTAHGSMGERFAQIHYRPGERVTWTSIDRLLMLTSLGLDRYPARQTVR